jgi:hypothetical protein
VASKGVADAFFVSVANEEVICTILVQFCDVFVSAANAGFKVPVFGMCDLKHRLAILEASLGRNSRIGSVHWKAFRVHRSVEPRSYRP